MRIFNRMGLNIAHPAGKPAYSKSDDVPWVVLPGIVACFLDKVAVKRPFLGLEGSGVLISVHTSYPYIPDRLARTIIISGENVIPELNSIH